jgi:hypothetical protein
MVTINGFNFKSLEAVHAVNTALVSCTRSLKDFCAAMFKSSTTFIQFLFNVNTWSFISGFFSKNNSTCFNYLFNPGIYARIFFLLYFITTSPTGIYINIHCCNMYLTHCILSHKYDKWVYDCLLHRSSTGVEVKVTQDLISGIWLAKNT